MPGIRVMIYEPVNGLRTGGEELLEDLPRADGAWLWADLEGIPKEREYELLTTTFGIRSLAIQDAHRERHPPKQELFDNYLFLLVRELVHKGDSRDDPEFSQISLFMGENFLVSRRKDPSASLNNVWETTTIEQMEKGPAHSVYRICRHIVDHFTPLVIDLEERLGDIEDSMFQHPSDELLADLAVYNRILKRFRRTLTYQHAVMKHVALSNDGVMRLFDDHEFNDVYENMERLASLCQLNQELAVDLLNTYISISSHRLNQIMRVLTIVTVIFVPLGLLAGIYGMNFENMPELHWRYGYFAVIGIMLGVVVTLITILRKKKWL